jgi:predicted AAA+ superfamily ATPase
MIIVFLQKQLKYIYHIYDKIHKYILGFNMNIEYFLRKQELNIRRTNTDFIRKKYLILLQSNERLIGLIGSRGVGKTTLLYQYLKLQDEKALYMSGDDIEFSNSKLYHLVDEFYALGGRLVVIDEVHKYKNWSQEIKNIYDSFPDLKIRISGSSMLNILYEKYDLSRRLVIYHMDTLNFKEYFELQEGINLPSYSFQDILTRSSDISTELVFKYKNIYGSFKEYLKYGAYPFFLEGLDSFNDKLYNALDKIIHEDIPSLNKIDYSHISIFEKLIFFPLLSKIQQHLQSV